MVHIFLDDESIFPIQDKKAAGGFRAIPIKRMSWRNFVKNSGIGNGKST